MSRHVLGPENPKTLQITSDLGWVADDQGKYPEAEKLLAQPMEQDRRILGQKTPRPCRP